MPVSLSSQFTQRSYLWTDWKAVEAIKGGQYQYDDDGVIYTAWFYDGPEVHVCTIWKGVVPDGILSGGYTQTQNDSDKSDFETNFKSEGNALIARRSEDGRPLQVFTITKTATNFQLRVFSFQTSTPSSLHNASPTGAMTDVTMTCYDVSGTNVTTGDLTTVVKTVMDLETTYPMEVVGGWLDIPDASHAAIVTSGPGTYYVSSIGVPDVPSAYGGSIPFVYEVDLALLPAYETRVVSDGMATQYLKPTVIGGTDYHTNKLRWIFKHPVGATLWFQTALRTFV